MSSDNGIIINRKTLEAYYYQGDSGHILTRADNLEELIDKVYKLIKEDEAEGFYLEYGIKFIN